MNYSRLLTTTLISGTLCTQSVFAAEKINVVASFSILGDLVQQVGGEHVSVSTLVGPNGDAHVYQPTPQDTIRLTKSQLFVVNGLGFEGWMERLVSASHYKGKVITASQSIKPQTFTDADDAAHPHVTQDPHAWHSIPNAVQYVHNIADGLSQIDPKHKVEYQANAGNYIQRLEQLDKSLLAEFAAIPADKRKMITSHDAFNDIDEPLKSIIQSYIQRDNNSYSSKIKSSLRRILFMYGLNAKSKDAKTHFLGSPSIRKFSNWRLDQESFSDDARSIKKACLTALNLFYSSSQDAKNLNITLKRSDSSVFQIAQLRICSVPESSFSVDYDAVKNLPFFYVKSNKKIRLDLSLPLLDYIDNILANDISDSLNPIYKTQLEKFKLNQIELKAA